MSGAVLALPDPYLSKEEINQFREDKAKEVLSKIYHLVKLSGLELAM